MKPRTMILTRELYAGVKSAGRYQLEILRSYCKAVGKAVTKPECRQDQGCEFTGFVALPRHSVGSRRGCQWSLGFP